MELNDFLQDLNRDTTQQIRHTEAEEKDVLKRAYACATILTEANAKLKTFITGYDFKNEQEEIHFFKYTKPALISQLIYHCQVYNIEFKHPVGDVEVRREYLHHELDKIQNYIECRPEFYSYYRLGITENDAYYFTRSQLEMGREYLEPLVSEREPRYSTNCDYELARIMANERLEILLKSQLDELEHPHQEKAQLSWTTKKTFLIELLYALDSFRAFGRVPLKVVVKIFERLLGIDLGNVSSAFSEMRTRNDPTPFLDSLKEVLLHRMKRSSDKKNT